MSDGRGKTRKSRDLHGARAARDHDMFVQELKRLQRAPRNITARENAVDATRERIAPAEMSSGSSSAFAWL